MHNKPAFHMVRWWSHLPHHTTGAFRVEALHRLHTHSRTRHTRLLLPTTLFPLQHTTAGAWGEAGGAEKDGGLSEMGLDPGTAGVAPEAVSLNGAAACCSAADHD